MPETQKLFCAVSKREFIDTLEAKQFFRTKEAVNDFVYHSKKQSFSPPYTYIFEIVILKKCLSELTIDEVELDKFPALSIHEDVLPDFS